MEFHHLYWTHCNNLLHGKFLFNTCLYMQQNLVSGEILGVTNSHPSLTLEAGIMRSCRDQIGLSQPETLGLSKSSWATALCNMVQEKQKKRWQDLETKCLTIADSVDEDECACQNSLTNVLRCFIADKQNFYKVRLDRNPFNIMRMNPFYVMKLCIPSCHSIDHRKKCSNTQSLSIQRLVIPGLYLFPSLNFSHI